MKSKKYGFTLVELLIVIAIIGVLAAMLTPMISSANKKALATTSKVLFTGMASALERYNDEYGYFPVFLGDENRTRTNLNDEKNAESLIKALTGKDAEGKKLSETDRRDFNRKSRNFFSFKPHDIINKDGTWKIVDSFGNPNIYICVDTDSDGFIKTGLPSISDGLSANEVKELNPNPTAGIRSKVLIYTLRKDSKTATADFMSENIFTW